jgi:hypothetical protein
MIKFLILKSTVQILGEPEKPINPPIVRLPATYDVGVCHCTSPDNKKPAKPCSLRVSVLLCTPADACLAKETPKQSATGLCYQGLAMLHFLMYRHLYRHMSEVAFIYTTNSPL